MIESNLGLSLDALKRANPDAYINYIKRELLEARNKQALKLAQFVEKGHLTIEQIGKATCSQLREASNRFSISEDTGDIFYNGITEPEKAKRKFLRILGLVDRPDYRAPHIIQNIINDIIAKNNSKPREPIITYSGQIYPHAEILAIVCGGSRFQAGKTPDKESDYDIEVLYARDSYLDIQEVSEPFQQLSQAGVQIAPEKYDKYIEEAYKVVAREAQIAAPFRHMNGLGFNPLLNPRSLIIAKPGYEVALHELATQMPPAYSEQPFGDPYYRPTVEEFGKMGLHTSAGWYADAVEELMCEHV